MARSKPQRRPSRIRKRSSLLKKRAVIRERRLVVARVTGDDFRTIYHWCSKHDVEAKPDSPDNLYDCRIGVIQVWSEPWPDKNSRLRKTPFGYTLLGHRCTQHHTSRGASDETPPLSLSRRQPDHQLRGAAEIWGCVRGEADPLFGNRGGGGWEECRSGAKWTVQKPAKKGSFTGWPAAARPVAALPSSKARIVAAVIHALLAFSRLP